MRVREGIPGRPPTCCSGQHRHSGLGAVRTLSAPRHGFRALACGEPRNDTLASRLGHDRWLDELTFAAGLTLLVAIAGFTVGGLFGALAASAKLSRSRLARGAADVYTTVLRGVPDLLVIYLFYFGGSAMLSAVARQFGYTGFVACPPSSRRRSPSGWSTAPTRRRCCAAPISPFRRASSRRPRPAGMSGWVRHRRIVIPQVLRFALPGLGNVWQLVLKESALVAVIGLTVHLPSIDIFGLLTLPEVRFYDLLRQAHVAAGSTRLALHLLPDGRRLLSAADDGLAAPVPAGRAGARRRRQEGVMDFDFLHQSTFLRLIQGVR